MKQIELLDCTLRDGGYLNGWNFGKQNIKDIFNTLNLSEIDYIECGFINNIQTYNINHSIFEKVEDVKRVIHANNNNVTLMMLISEYDISKLPECNKNTPVKNIRLSFHKNELKDAIRNGKIIKNKGYNLFFQPTVTMSYDYEELLYIIKLCNDTIKPYAFAIVDTLGEMLPDDIIRLTKLCDTNLDKNIRLLFHSHNNLQLAFSNSINFIKNVNDSRKIIIDSSLLGMGKDSGNTCTELMVWFLNKYFCKKYDYEAILMLIQNTMLKLQADFKWGYSATYLINAINKTHSKYTKFIKKHLPEINLLELNALLSEIPQEKRNDFDLSLANSLIKNKGQFNAKYQYF